MYSQTIILGHTVLLAVCLTRPLGATAIYQNSPVNASLPGNVTNQTATLLFQLSVNPIGKPPLTLQPPDNKFDFTLSDGAGSVERRVPTRGLYFGGYSDGIGRISPATYDAKTQTTTVKGSVVASAQAPTETGGDSTSVVQLLYKGNILGQAGVDTKLGQLGPKDDSTISANSSSSISTVEADFSIGIDGQTIGSEIVNVSTLGGSAALTEAAGLTLTSGAAAGEYAKYNASGSYLFSATDNYIGSAEILNGVFTTTGFLSAQPWQLTTDASGDVLAAHLDAAFFPSPVVNWTASDNGSHSITYEQTASAYDSAPAPTATPEPASWVLFAGGIGLILFSRVSRFLRSGQAIAPGLHTCINIVAIPVSKSSSQNRWSGLSSEIGEIAHGHRILQEDALQKAGGEKIFRDVPAAQSMVGWWSPRASVLDGPWFGNSLISALISRSMRRL